MYPNRAREWGLLDGMPEMKHVPVGDGVRLRTALIADVFPAPFGPMNPTISPLLT